MKTHTSILVLAGMLSMSAQAWASGDHQHAHNPCMANMQQEDGHAHGMKAGTFLQKAEIDGYTVSFHVMKAPEGMAHGGPHHFMIKVEKNGAVVPLKAVNSKVVHPGDQSESKMMMKMGDWYMAGYDLSHEGEHQLMVLFKTEDGSKHFGGVRYPAKD